MVSKDWEKKGEVAYEFRQMARLWKKGWITGPKTKKGKKGFYDRLVKTHMKPYNRKRWD